LIGELESFGENTFIFLSFEFVNLELAIKAEASAPIGTRNCNQGHCTIKLKTLQGW
jgi:hypothetical protein